jgi:hypothetical protein
VPERFLELPSSYKYSHIALSYAAKEMGKLGAKFPLAPKKFGWLTELGIYAGDVEPSGGDADTVTVDCQGSILRNSISAVNDYDNFFLLKFWTKYKNPEHLSLFYGQYYCI